MAAWFCTFGSAARRNGARAHAPGDTLMCPQTVRPNRPPGTRTRERLRHGVGRRAPDAAEARDDVEAAVVPRQRVHVADSDVGIGISVAGNGHQAGRCIDARAAGAAQPREFQGETRAAGDVEQSVAVHPHRVDGAW